MYCNRINHVHIHDVVNMVLLFATVLLAELCKGAGFTNSIYGEESVCVCVCP